MPTHRPRKTAGQWQSLLKQYDASELSIVEFCKQQGVALSTFSKWQRRLKNTPVKKETAFKKVVTSAPAVTNKPDSQPSLISVKVGSEIVLTIRSGELLP